MEFNIATVVGLVTIAGAAISVVWSIMKFRERLLTLEYKTNSIEDKVNNIDKKLDEKINIIDKKLDELIADTKKFREDYYKLNNDFVRVQTKLEMKQPTT